MTQILMWLLENPETVFLAIVTLVGMVKGKPWYDAFMAEKRTREILQMAEIAFNAVEEMSRVKPMQTVEKIAVFGEKLTQLALAAGVGELEPGEKGMAMDVARALNHRQRTDPGPH